MERNNKGPKMTFILKQQTPMIHFQYDEPGACLRASEVKPKLDRFIKEHYAGEHDGEDVPDSWYICAKKDGKRTNEALNYKMQIRTTGTAQVNPKINRMYFGNMGDDRSNDKQTVFYSGNIELIITSFVPQLRDYIAAVIAEFFDLNNFGTRQDKGFGGFTVQGTGKNVLKRFEGYKKNGNCRNCFYVKNILSVDDKLNIAAAVYAVMKGGINYKGAYIKGYIQRQYLDDIGQTNTGSDKAYVKSYVKKATARPGKEPEYEKYVDYVYVRALLGVADHIEFQDPDSRRKGKVTISSDDIQRFKSTVTIKIIDNYIFFIITDEYKNILSCDGKKIILAFTGDEPTDGKNMTISTPSEFDPDRFIDGFMAYYAENKSQLKKMSDFQNAASVELMKLTSGGMGNV